MGPAFAWPVVSSRLTFFRAQGNGLTVERSKVEVYAELAKLLFSNLFGFDLDIEEKGQREVLSEFIAAWSRLKRAAAMLTARASQRESRFSNEGESLRDSPLVVRESAWSPRYYVQFNWPAF